MIWYSRLGAIFFYIRHLMTDRQTDRQTDRKTDRPTDRQRNRHDRFKRQKEYRQKYK